MAIPEAIWSLKDGNNLYNKNGNNNYNKALNPDLDYPSAFWYLDNSTNLKTGYIKDILQKAMTEDLDYPVSFWFIKNQTNVKNGATKDTFQKAMTRFDYENNIVTYPKLLWYLQEKDNRTYFNNGFHNLNPFRCMTKLDVFVKTYPKALWQAPEWEYYEYTFVHPISPSYELLGAFCHSKKIKKLNISRDTSFGEFITRESDIDTISVKPNVNIDYKDYSFKEGTDIIIEE